MNKYFLGAVVLLGILTGCSSNTSDSGLSAYEIYKKYHKNYKGSEEEWINAYCNGDLAKSYNTTYNIIYTLATIPPVLAALDSIDNGYETYALIERGKTYSGINNSKFHNIGFDPNDNTSSGFNEDKFNLVVDKINELNIYGNEKFNIYVQDGIALEALGLVSNANLDSNQFKIIMLEDGTGAYDALMKGYISGRTVTSTNDSIYNNYISEVNRLKGIVDDVLTRDKISKNESIFNYNIQNAFALGALDNFTYWLQDYNQIKNILENASSTDGTNTKLLSVFNINGYNDEVDYKINTKYKEINDCVNELSDEKRIEYLSLMYGKYYNDTYSMLTRGTLSDNVTSVPNKKLIFIGSKINFYPDLASTLGINKATSINDIPDNYDLLDSKYKTPLLFSNKDDYNLFINIINASSSYLNTSNDSIRVNAFNYYINYIMTLKYTYLQYGNTYDIIIKGHPSEVLGEYQNWTSHYTANGVNYDRLINDLSLSFHNNDSIGKYIGIIPYGTAAENLAYLGTDISICGLNSSTYTGYDSNVDVLFVLENTDNDITKNNNLNSRYDKGNLNYHIDGEAYVTRYDNRGNIFKNLIKLYSDLGYNNLALKYQNIFNEWLKDTFKLDNINGYDINEQGILIKK